MSLSTLATGLWVFLFIFALGVKVNPTLCDDFLTFLFCVLYLLLLAVVGLSRGKENSVLNLSGPQTVIEKIFTASFSALLNVL